MSIYIICENGIQREMTIEEAARYESAANKVAQEITESKNAKEQRAAARAAALEKLGLSADEIEALFG